MHLTVKIKLTTGAHFHSKLTIQTGNRSKRCLFGHFEDLLSEFQLRVGWDEGEDTAEGTQREKPHSRIIGEGLGSCQGGS